MGNGDFYCDHLFAALNETPVWLARGEDWEEEVELELVEVGEFELPTGVLCACDYHYGCRFDDDDHERYIKTFVKRITPGIYRFQVCIARYEYSDPRQHPDFENYPAELVDGLFPASQSLKRDERAALAIIRKGDSRIARWELAEIQGERSPHVSYEVQHTCPVDADIIAYFDSALATELRKTGLHNKAQVEQMREAIDALLLKNYDDTRTWAAFGSQSNRTSSIVLCSTGGSGAFPSYWGFDSAGNLACLVTDFHFLYCLDI